MPGEARRRGNEVLQHRQRRPGRPLQVVEHEQHRPAVGDEREPAEHGFVQRVRIAVIRAGLRVVRGEVRAHELGDEPRELGAVAGPHHADAGRRRVREVVAEPLGDRLERVPRDLVAAAVEDGVAAGSDRLRELGREPGLARTGLAGHERGAEAARVARFGPRRRERTELGRAARRTRTDGRS